MSSFIRNIQKKQIFTYRKQASGCQRLGIGEWGEIA